MSEINRIQGPGGAEPGGRRDRSGNVDDKFRKIMKVEEVHEIDPREKRKRKRPEEAEDESEGLKKASGVPTGTAKKMETEDAGPLARKKTTPKAPPPAPPKQTPHAHDTPLSSFSAQEIEAYAWEEEANAPSSPVVSGTTTPKSRSTPPPEIEGLGDKKTLKTSKPEEPTTSPAAQVPPAEEPQLHFSSEEDFREEALPPSASPPEAIISEEWPQTTTYRPDPGLPVTDALSFPQKSTLDINDRTANLDDERPVAEPARTERKKTSKKRDDDRGLPSKKTDSTKTFAEHMRTEDADKTAKNKKLSSEEQAQLAEAAKKESGIAGAKEGFPSQKKTGASTISADKTREKDTDAIEGQVPLVAPSTSQAGTDFGEGQSKRREKEGVEEAATAAAIANQPPPLTPGATPPTPVSAPYSQMEPQIMALFERMVGVMTIIQTTGITETVMTLNARQFASSVLYGSQIIIREFSTAPKAFNVEFIGSPEALVQVERNLPALLGAVQQGNYQFSINRFDTKLGSTEKPIFSRKESVDERTDQDTQDNEKDQNSP